MQTMQRSGRLSNRNRERISRLATRNGAALVEFAVVLPIILLIFAGMIEISRVLLLQHSADTAAYEGARSAMVPGASSDEAVKAAQTLLLAAKLNSSTITVTPQLITEEPPLITVRVEIPIAANAWIAPFWFSNNCVTSEVTLFCERPPVVQLTGVPALKNLSKRIKGGGTLL